MEVICADCGAKDKGVTGMSCSECGGTLIEPERPRRAREYDGYAVGRRLLRLAPAWLLLIAVAFALALLIFSWLGRRAGTQEGDAFINEATNRAPAADENSKGSEAKSPRVKSDAATQREAAPAEEATPTSAAPSSTPTPQGLGESEAYSVQVGAFASISDANEQVSRLRAAGFEARVVESDASTRFRFHVRSGLYATREEAASLAARLRAAGAAGQTVIIEPEKR